MGGSEEAALPVRAGVSALDVADLPADPAQWGMAALMDFCRIVAPTDFVPRALRGNRAAVLACIMTGREMRLGPMESLQHVFIVDGRPTLSAQVMRALIQRAGHQLVIHYGPDSCTVTGTRADNQEVLEVTWSKADAQLAGLLGKTNWKTYPRAMLLARATSELARALFADVLGPARYTPEELES